MRLDVGQKGKGFAFSSCLPMCHFYVFTLAFRGTSYMMYFEKREDMHDVNVRATKTHTRYT